MLRMLEELAAEMTGGPIISANLIAYPFHWQEPAATEKAAYEALEAIGGARDFVYLGFPWATLIDGLRNESAISSSILRALTRLTKLPVMGNFPKRRATVAQHIHAHKFIGLYRACGVTDLLWSHACVERLEIEGIRIHPFPLFPAQAADIEGMDDIHRPRRWLANFIGAYNPKIYLSDVRAHIFGDEGKEGLLIVKRDAWHFDRAVYSQQILGNSADSSQLEREKQHKTEYLDAIRNSTFTLCPTGSGPNSIRIGEALALGSIPIILTKGLALPGDRVLWERACLFEEDTAEGYRRVMARARAMDKKELLRRQVATQTLYARIKPSKWSELIIETLVPSRLRTR